MFSNQAQAKIQKPERHKTLRLIEDYTNFIDQNISRFNHEQHLLQDQIFEATHAMQVIAETGKIPPPKECDTSTWRKMSQLTAIDEYLSELEENGIFTDMECELQCDLLEQRMRRFLSAD